ncbi:MAG: G1 family glutamic endopeptidase [Methylocella sp.]
MMDYKLLVYLGAAMLLPGAALSVAHAQITMPTNVPGIRVVAPPPAGFDPVTATPAARKQYAIPPAPDPTAAPGAYQQWRKAMGGLRNRPAAPVLRQTNIYNGPIKNKKVSASVPPGNTVTGPNFGKIAGPPSNNIVAASSSNWSGPSIVATSGNPFALEAIQGEFVVPVAQQSFGTCSGGWNYSSLWPGIDGNGSGDVLQGGVEADAYCSGGVTETFYSAWIEWYPFDETRVSSPAINPGDLVFIQVWNASPTLGFAYFYDYSSQESNEYQLTAPGGTTLQGNSVEWIVERPGVGGGLAHLTNYIDASWPYNIAWNYEAAKPTYYYPGADPAPYTLELITMLGGPSGSGSAISYGSPQNFDFLYFEDTGGAHGTGPVAPYY